MRDMPDKNSHFDFRGFDDRIEVFRSGTHVSSNGVKRTWTNEELDQMVANHSAETAAPIVIGHPENTDPAYGWVESLERDGDSLYAKFRGVNEDFSSSVERGEYRKRSIRVYKTPENTFAIEHVGFLGAKRPAIPLESMSYQAVEADEVFDFEVDAYTPGAVARMLRGIRDLFIDKFGVDAADKAVPDYAIDSLSDHANNLQTELQDQSSFSSPAAAGGSQNDPSEGDDNVSKFTQADLDAAKKAGKDEAEAEFSAKDEARQQELEEERRKNRNAEFTAFVNGLECDPAMKEGMVDFMHQLPDGDDAQYEFSAGDGDGKKTVKVTPLQFFKDFVSGLKSSVDFTESDAGDGVEPGQHNFAAPEGMHVDEQMMGLHNRALDYQAKHPEVDYNTAVDKVSQEGK